jgi:hypothetical protein
MTGHFVLFEAETKEGGVERVFRHAEGGRADRREKEFSIGVRLRWQRRATRASGGDFAGFGIGRRGGLVGGLGRTP